MSGTPLLSMDRGDSHKNGHKAVLDQHPSMIVKQTKKGCLQVELLAGFSANQEYVLAGVKSPRQKAMYALEESSCFNRFCCGNMRAYELHLSEQRGSERILTYKRPLRCGPGSLCFQQEMSAWSGEEFLGKTKIPCYCCRPKLAVYDKSDAQMFTITKQGSCPCCVLSFCQADFAITNMEGTEVGRVAKLQGSFLQEMFTNADTFQVDFPGNLDADMKAVMLSSTFLLDMNFFEKESKYADEFLDAV